MFKTKIKLATFREYYNDGEQFSGLVGVYRAIACSICDTPFIDKSCDRLSITNEAGWYAAQINCSCCEKTYVTYYDMEEYVVTVNQAKMNISTESTSNKTEKILSKYANINAIQYLSDSRGDMIQRFETALVKDQICKGCKKPFMVRYFDSQVEDLIHNGDGELEIYCKCEKGYSIILDAVEVYNKPVESNFEEDDEDEYISDFTSCFGNVRALQYVNCDPDDEDDEIVKDAEESILKLQRCENCGSHFLTEDAHENIKLAILHHAKGEDIILECLGCDSEVYYLKIMYEDALAFASKSLKEEAHNIEQLKAKKPRLEMKNSEKSIYYDVPCTLFVKGVEADFKLASDKLGELVCEKCQLPFITPSIDQRIDIMVENTSNNGRYEINCTECGTSSIVLDYDDVNRIYEKEKAKTHRKVKKPQTDEDTFFSSVDPNGLESSFFK